LSHLKSTRNAAARIAIVKLKSDLGGGFVRTTLYFIRHAQSNPQHSLDNSEYPLSEVGEKQADDIVPLLQTLNLTRMYCSPFLRCRQTIRPFVKQTNIEVSTHEALREMKSAAGLIADFEAVWQQSWDDSGFALPGCESSREAVTRFSGAVAAIVAGHPGETIGISSHGHVIGLFLNQLQSSFGGNETKALRNPDIIKVTHAAGQFEWDRGFDVPGLSRIATSYTHVHVEISDGPPTRLH
jgi:2,3-bisphosphoglycerate-dependent phosphoglycerate mutase